LISMVISAPGLMPNDSVMVLRRPHTSELSGNDGVPPPK
jgi:hypothetical protein